MVCSERTKEDEEPAAKLLDDLFCKTTTRPCLYWLPLTEDEVCFIRRWPSNYIFHIFGVLIFNIFLTQFSMVLQHFFKFYF